MSDELDTIIDQADQETTAAPEQPKKTRGRKASSTAKPTGSKKEKISARQLTGLLYLGHATAADALKTPEIAIQEDEAAAIAAAVVDVLQYYDFDASAKTLAWANLFGTCATIYGLKIYAIMQKGHDVGQDQ